MPCQAAIDLATAAVEADVTGDAVKAVDLYERAANELDAAARANPAEASEMRGKAAEYRARVAVLKQKIQADQVAAMATGAAAMQQGAQAVHQGQQAVATAGGYSTVAGAAAVGATAGALLMGPMSAVVAAGAAAYATTRKDSVGDVARSTGETAAATASGLKKFNDEHKITSKVYDAGVAAAAKAKEVNAKYGISTKMSEGANYGVRQGGGVRAEE